MDVELARRRLALDEFVALQLQIQGRRKKFEAQAQALPCGGDNRWMKPFLAQLGFKLTAAQTRVLREIRTDMSGAHPMRRLLQGDVGSGKTAVAACAALMTLESGFNVALMAPKYLPGRFCTEKFWRNSILIIFLSGLSRWEFQCSCRPGVAAGAIHPPGARVRRCVCLWGHMRCSLRVLNCAGWGWS